YHYADGVLTQITEDHSLVEALVRDGRLTPEEAEVHPQRNVLTRALGVEAYVEVYAWVLAPADGDRFLLCSDGLFNEITDTQIAEVLESAKDPDTAARLLAERAETAGGRDNITTVVVDVSGTGQALVPVGERLRRVVVPPADLSDIEAQLVADHDGTDEPVADAVDTTANFPPVVAPLVDDEAAFLAETPADAAAEDDELADPAEVPVVVADEPGRAGWRSKVFLVAVALVVLVGVAAIVVGVLASQSGSPAPTTVRPATTTTAVSTTSTSTPATTTTVTTLPVVTVPSTLPPGPAPAVSAPSGN
ncbi:MAG: hypothetical protein ACKO04_06845, partial [Actinomycetes bacterium]